MALQITGQLTTSDSAPLKDTINYARLSMEVQEDATIILVTVKVYRGKIAFLAGNENIHRVTEIKRRYIIDAARLATLPINNIGINAMIGKSAFDKMHYWINQEVLNQIMIDNPTFLIEIKDVNI